MEILTSGTIGTAASPMIVFADFALVIRVQMSFCSELVLTMGETAIVAPFAVTSRLKVLAQLSLIFQFIAFQQFALLTAFACRQQWGTWFDNLRLLAGTGITRNLVVTS